MHNTVIQNFYTLQNDHHSLVTIIQYYWLYLPYSIFQTHHHFFYNESLYFLTSLTYFNYPLIFYKASFITCFWRRQWHPTPVLLPGKYHGWRSLVGCSPWGRWGLDTTEQLHFHFDFHALEKEMATHSSVFAWRIPAVYGVAQSWTRLKWLSSLADDMLLLWLHTLLSQILVLCMHILILLIKQFLLQPKLHASSLKVHQH